ncbi:protein kinase [Sphaerotilus natans]|uniref:protein kinase n=1 Tax=Sphaerotilus natans TaxID=34103 RepID=UPI00406C71BA
MINSLHRIKSGSTLAALRRGDLAGTRRLDLRGCNLERLPEEVFALADTLEELDLGDNRLSTLPDTLPRLHRLRVIFGSGNPFTELPEVLGACGQLSMIGFRGCQIDTVPGTALPPRLRWLILTDNHIARLPDTLAERPDLEKLMLAGNRLEALPDLSASPRLALLRLAANHFSTAPGWLVRHPALAWLALSGNPFFHRLFHRLSPSEITTLSPCHIKEDQLIGEGASGLIHRAWLSENPPLPARPVALKRFKAAMTSDGLPDCEQAACLAAAGHASIVAAEARVADAQGRTEALVLPLLGPEFRPLAGPPSLASCSRDVYADGLTMPVDKLWTILKSIASAAAHLHRVGLMHGDLYAHNILWNGEDRALLSDFGAASFLPEEAGLRAGLERLEVRAFGLLVEELLQRADDPADARCARLSALREDCLQPKVARRPAFGEISARLGPASAR